MTRIELESGTNAQARTDKAKAEAISQITGLQGKPSGFVALDASSGLLVPKHLVRKGQAVPTQPTTGWLDYIDSADGQHKTITASGQVKRQVFDWGQGATMPSGARRGDVFYLTSALALCVYSAAGWRLVEPGTVSTYADLKNLPTEVQYLGARVRTEGRLWEFNGTFWDNLSVAKPIGARMYRTGVTTYVAGWAAVPYEASDTAYYNPSLEWFDVRLAERRIKILRGGRFKIAAEIVTARTTPDQYFGLAKVTTASTPDTQRLVSTGPFSGAMSVSAEVDLATNDYVGAAIYSVGADQADGTNGYHNHFTITRLPS